MLLAFLDQCSAAVSYLFSSIPSLTARDDGGKEENNSSSKDKAVETHRSGGLSEAAAAAAAAVYLCLISIANSVH